MRPSPINPMVGKGHLLVSGFSSGWSLLLLAFLVFVMLNIIRELDAKNKSEWLQVVVRADG